VQTRMFDWRRLKERSRWAWGAAALLTFLSLGGAWNPGFETSIGDCTYSGASCGYGGQGLNGWSTGAWFVPVVLVGLALLYALRRSDASSSPMVRTAPLLLAAALTAFAGIWLVKILVDASDAFAGSGVVYSRTFPSGFGWFLLALVVFWAGAIAVRRSDRRSAVATLATGGAMTPPPAPSEA
jgi:hypothetical protein